MLFVNVIFKTYIMEWLESKQVYEEMLRGRSGHACAKEHGISLMVLTKDAGTHR